MPADKHLPHPIAPRQSDTLVLDALTRYVAQSGTMIGEKLPPERVLAQGLAVSRNTVREAHHRVPGGQYCEHANNILTGLYNYSKMLKSLYTSDL